MLNRVDLEKVISSLRMELEGINNAIRSLEAMASSGTEGARLRGPARPVKPTYAPQSKAHSTRAMTADRSENNPGGA